MLNIPGFVQLAALITPFFARLYALERPDVLAP